MLPVIRDMAMEHPGGQGGVRPPSSAPESSAASDLYTRSSAASRRHPGVWRKKIYRLGRHVDGGMWSCCGIRDNLLRSCSEEEQRQWKEHLREQEAQEAARVARRARAQEHKRAWEQAAEGTKIETPSISRASTPAALSVSTTTKMVESTRFGGHDIHAFSPGSGKKFLARDVPMLVSSFRDSKEDWSASEALTAALSFIDTTSNRVALVREGIIEVTKRQLCASTSELDAKGPPSSLESDDPVLSHGTQTLCVRLLAALAECAACRAAFEKDEQLALIVGIFLRHSPKIDPGDLFTILEAGAASEKVQRALAQNKAPAVWRRSRDQSQTVDYITEMLRTLRRAGVDVITLRRGETDESDVDHDEIQCALRAIHFGFKTLSHLASLGSEVRTRLRQAGAVELSIGALSSIHTHLRGYKKEALCILALSAALLLHCRVAVFENGDVHDASVLGLDTVYNVIRSRLSRTEIQLQGLSLMNTLAHTNAGALKLDSIEGAWQWLGLTNMRCDPDGGPYNWCCAEDPDYVSKEIMCSPSMPWTAFRLARFLDLRRQEESLQEIVDRLSEIALLPFETETPVDWKVRVRAFERRNNAKILDRILGHSRSTKK